MRSGIYANPLVLILLVTKSILAHEKGIISRQTSILLKS
jgi:hypothetical protein